jgi:N-glycosylase/DNA lyase
MELPGVGDKVADCVLLFALGHGQAFPVDVWIKRTMESYYFGGRKATIREIHDLAHARFGVWAGYAQQYIFHHARLRNRSHE